MKIIFLTYDLPFPLDQGGKIRSFHLLKNLSRNHQITLFSFYREEKQKKDLKKLRSFCQKILLFKRVEAFSLAHFYKLKTRLPFPAALYWSPALESKLKQEVKKTDYDLIHFESFYLSPYLNEKIKTPQVLGTENIEWQVYQQYAQTKKFPLKNLMLFEVRRTKKFEESTWRKAQAILAVSGENAHLISQVTNKKCHLIPNGVDLGFFRIKTNLSQNKKTILFVGNFSYIQNQDAASYLIKEIFPLILKKIPGCELLIVGRRPPPEILNCRSSQVKVISHLDDIREAYRQADILLAPIRAGSGTKFKILEAMASGLPVVTTKIGAEGIKARKDEEIIIEDDPKLISLAAVDLLTDEDQYHRFSLSGRRVVEENYDWVQIVKKLEKIYEEIIGGQN